MELVLECNHHLQKREGREKRRGKKEKGGEEGEREKRKKGGKRKREGHKRGEQKAGEHRAQLDGSGSPSRDAGILLHPGIRIRATVLHGAILSASKVGSTSSARDRALPPLNSPGPSNGSGAPLCRTVLRVAETPKFQC